MPDVKGLLRLMRFYRGPTPDLGSFVVQKTP
jgi:hypothetical protein